ncbi:MAG: tRNA (uridine(34)/cytosine(34)/5-carboxymethylaminomethyluridine(34)-2'-O)-methyltransferase TrmL [bacterium]
MHVVLHEPEIPQNTGNIARTCAVTGTILHLVKPLGFSIEDRYLKRAGLDYWNQVELHCWDNFQQLLAAYIGGRFYYLTTKGNRSYHTITYQSDDFLVFGSETRGLPDELLTANKEFCLRVPMRPGLRSLNLSNTVALVLYEGLRQQGFVNLV